MSSQRLLNRDKISLLLLLSLSVFSTAMLLARVIYSGQLTHIYLAWNIFLAWLPLLFASVAQKQWCKPFFLTTFSFLWLLFLPNAPYLITDLIHLRPVDAVPLWYDAALLFSFAISGLLLGLRSLSTMQQIVNRRFGHFGGWLLVFGASGLSGFGIYIGRFLRWNSWDVFVHPYRLSLDIFQSLQTPVFLAKAVVVVLVFTVITAGAYVFWYGPGVAQSARADLRGG